MNLYRCPKSDKCVMDCYHKTPHEHDEKYCNGSYECPKCVIELLSDILFFEEDFEL